MSRFNVVNGLYNNSLVIEKLPGMREFSKDDLGGKHKVITKT